MIADELDSLINTIASEVNNIDDDDKIKISYDLIILREKFNI